MPTLLELAVQVYTAADPTLKLLRGTEAAYESPQNRVTFVFHEQIQAVSVQWVDVGTMTQYHGLAYSEAELHKMLRSGREVFEARRTLLQRARDAGFLGVASFKSNTVEVSQVVLQDAAGIQRALGLGS